MPLTERQRVFPIMRTAPTAFALAITFLFSACGGSKHAATAEESVTLMERISTALESVKDEATAKAAAAKLETTITRMTTLKKEMEALGKPVGAAGDALKAKYEARTQAAIAKMTGTRVAGFVMTRQEAPGDWGVATYQLKPTT